jgi:hypothetical protein
MSSLRPATVIEALVEFIGLKPRPHPEGPGCTCESCEEAWTKHHPPAASPERDQQSVALRR